MRALTPVNIAYFFPYLVLGLAYVGARGILMFPASSSISSSIRSPSTWT